MTSWVIVSSARRIFGKVIRFICGHRLRAMTHEVTVDPEVAERARRAVERMMALG